MNFKILNPIIAALVFLSVGSVSTAEAGEITVGQSFIVYSGEVVEGDVDKLDSVLKKTGPTLVFLNSGGGSVQAGLDMMELIYNSGSNTMVVEGDKCLSICASMWLGGHQRLSEGSLGVHQPFLMPEYAVSLTQYEYANEVMKTLAYMIYRVENLGITVDPMFWMALASTFAGEMYVFTEEDLTYLEQ